MLIHRIKRGLKSRIPLDADKVTSALINGGQIANKYIRETKSFSLSYEDTEDLENGILSISYEKDGEKLTRDIKLEII